MRKSYLSCSKDFEQTKTKSVNSCGFKIRRYFTWKKATTSFGCGFRVQLKNKKSLWLPIMDNSYQINCVFSSLCTAHGGKHDWGSFKHFPANMIYMSSVKTDKFQERKQFTCPKHPLPCLPRRIFDSQSLDALSGLQLVIVPASISTQYYWLLRSAGSFSFF